MLEASVRWIAAVQGKRHRWCLVHAHSSDWAARPEGCPLPSLPAARSRALLAVAMRRITSRHDATDVILVLKVTIEPNASHMLLHARWGGGG